MKKNILIVFLLCIIVLFYFSGCGESAYIRGHKDGYDEGRSIGFDEGYDEGFQSATNFILDRMDPSYLDEWWEQNIDEIQAIGLEF